MGWGKVWVGGMGMEDAVSVMGFQVQGGGREGQAEKSILCGGSLVREGVQGMEVKHC